MINRCAVSKISLFAELAAKQIDDILTHVRARRAAKNMVVLRQGHRADEVQVLLSGRLKLSKIAASGEQMIIRFIRPGELFGSTMAFGTGTYPATAVAVVDSIALSWPIDVWMSLMGSYPVLAMRAMQAIAERLQEAESRLSELSSLNVEKRVAQNLARLAANGGGAPTQNVAFDFPVSRQDLAEMAGTTLHTVSRIFSAWEDEGLVSTAGRCRIVITDADRLMALAN